MDTTIWRKMRFYHFGIPLLNNGKNGKQNQNNKSFMSDTNLVCKKGYQQSSLNELVITFLKSIYKNGYQQSSLNELIISFL